MKDESEFNGDRKKFKYWVDQIMKKLRVDSYQFDSEERKVNYILERMEEGARKVIGVPGREFEIVEEFHKVLLTLFKNHNEKEEARIELLDLHHKDYVFFQDFLADFHIII